MIQRTAFKAPEHKGQLVLLGLTCLVESCPLLGKPGSLEP